VLKNLMFVTIHVSNQDHTEAFELESGPTIPPLGAGS
jgi:hypothetical protein